ncbi:TPA: FMN-dependent NADH-azoreductase [Staphylococcus aureus]
MAKVLYITAHPFNELVSNSMAAGKAFIETYQQQHPDDEVKHIDLFETYIPVIDKDVLTGWGKMSNGETLTDDEQMKVSRLSDILEEFLSADKYVFVTPMWNLSFPPVVKAYIDAISIAGKTFKYSAEGPQGLLTDKKVLHIQSRGGYYTEDPAANFEMGDRYLRTIMTFLGVPSYETIIIEEHNAEPHKTEEIKATSINNAEKLATTF